MLKIKDDVDLKELAKDYNFIYCSNWREPYEDDNYGYLVYNDVIFINWEDFGRPIGSIKIIGSRNNEEVLDKLYDLIQAGLVEKVEG